MKGHIAGGATLHFLPLPTQSRPSGFQRNTWFLRFTQTHTPLGISIGSAVMKLLKTGSADVVKDCQICFAIDLPSCVLKGRQDKFILRYISAVNGFCQVCNKYVIVLN